MFKKGSKKEEAAEMYQRYVKIVVNEGRFASHSIQKEKVCKILTVLTDLIRVRKIHCSVMSYPYMTRP